MIGTISQVNRVINISNHMGIIGYGVWLLRKNVKGGTITPPVIHWPNIVFYNSTFPGHCSLTNLLKPIIIFINFASTPGQVFCEQQPDNTPIRTNLDWIQIVQSTVQVQNALLAYFSHHIPRQSLSVKSCIAYVYHFYIISDTKQSFILSYIFCHFSSINNNCWVAQWLRQ